MDQNTVYRCQYCNAVVTGEEIRVNGACECGSRKVRPAFAITDDEMEAMKARGFQAVEGQFSENREEAWTGE